MTFDKTKAMRNAEKYLAQGKIRSAIGEYEQVVKFDSKDFGTINMLGDLYSKNTDVPNAIKCYAAVAEHYGRQGFAQKAIAVYNKITRLDPHSVDVWHKLADLYKVKGSLSEARMHYRKVADHLERTGRKLEALAIWKEIALLDPSNTEAYLSLGDGYFGENQMDEAVEAYTEAGNGFAKKLAHEDAIRAFNKALTIKRADFKALSGLARSHMALGRARECANKIEELIEEFPHNRELRFLLIDCLVEAFDIAAAEKAVIKLVEIEPANYPKFLEIAHIYIANADVASAARILSMSSEHMLVGGQADQFNGLVDALLELDADNLDAVRLKARFCSWQREEKAICRSLARLAEVAKAAGSVEDERFALTQLVMLVPHEMGYRERLSEINKEHGYETAEAEENLFEKRFFKSGNGIAAGEAIDFVTEAEDAPGDYALETFEPVLDEPQSTDFAFTGEVSEVTSDVEAADLAGDDLRLRKELDSIRFYIDNGYLELAEKAADEMFAEWGDRAELRDLIDEIRFLNSPPDEDETAGSGFPEVAIDEPRSIGLDDLRTELGLEESARHEDGDFETSYNTAIAYREMGLTEQAIKEFQQAASLVGPNDGTRRFYDCANLLGFCFMDQSMPKLALKWFERALETQGLETEEKQAVWYELAAAYEALGDAGTAGQYFEQVYSENANFRDVSERIRNLAVGR